MQCAPVPTPPNTLHRTWQHKLNHVHGRGGATSADTTRDVRRLHQRQRGLDRALFPLYTLGTFLSLQLHNWTVEDTSLTRSAIASVTMHAAMAISAWVAPLLWLVQPVADPAADHPESGYLLPVGPATPYKSRGEAAVAACPCLWPS